MSNTISWSIVYPNGSKHIVNTFHDGNMLHHLEQLKKYILDTIKVEVIKESK